MPNLKDIKTRIQSVENTKKITRAMKMVAAARVKKAENNVKASRPFSQELITVFKKFFKAINDYPTDGVKIKMALENYPELLKRRDVKTAGILVVTSNKGLAGAYNANIVRSVIKHIQDNKAQGIETKLFIVGQKGINALKRKTDDIGFEILKTYTQVVNEISAAGAEEIAQDLAESFVSQQIDTIEIITTKFRNMMSYAVENWEIFPIKLDDSENEASAVIDPIMLFEPSEQSILQKIVPLYITNTIYQSLLEAQASELASRMTAMSAASNNAEDMIRILTIDYNKARQAAITQELLEVVSGADALKG